jgi:ribosomal protein S18 acetylase RimI-like enzyme
MHIRFLTAEHANEWSRLRLEALKGDPEAFSSSVEEHHALAPGEIKRRLGSSAEDSFVVGAFEDDRLVGIAGFFREKGPKTRHKGRIWGVYVTPEHRGRGVARQMFRKILERAERIEGVEQILISVTTTQTAAAKLYRSLGFETFGTESRALKIGDHYIDEDYMILDINASQT